MLNIFIFFFLLEQLTRGLEKVAEEIKTQYRVKCLSVICDVTDTDKIKEAVAAIIEEYRKIDALINNAGSDGIGPAEETSDEAWMYTIKYGRIINIPSMYGFVGNTVALFLASLDVSNITGAIIPVDGGYTCV